MVDFTVTKVILNRLTSSKLHCKSVFSNVFFGIIHHVLKVPVLGVLLLMSESEKNGDKRVVRKDNDKVPDGLSPGE